MTNQLNKAFSKISRNTKVALASLVIITSVTAVHAAPYPTDSKLSIDAGVGSAINVPCSAGSCFGMEVSPGLVIWTSFEPGSDGGLVIGKNQNSGGQELAPSSANTATGEATAAWSFFANFGTNYTPTGATDNVFDDAGCAGATCTGKTALGSWNVAWNGTTVPMGSVAGCNSTSCSAAQNAGIYISNYTASGAGGGAYTLEYSNVVPNGDSSSFGNVKYTLVLRGTVTLPNVGTVEDVTTFMAETGAIAANSFGTIAGLTEAQVGADPEKYSDGQQCVGGCLDYVITGLATNGATEKVVFRLTAPIPANAVMRKKINGTWSSFDTSGNNAIGSRPSSDGTASGSCQRPTGTYTSGLVAGYHCIELTIVDGGPNDADGLANKTITDPAGVGVLGTAPDLRTSGNSGCSIAGTPGKFTNHLDWVLLLGFMSWMGLRRNKWFSKK